MLGEAAMTFADADRYFDAYRTRDPRDRHEPPDAASSKVPASRSSFRRCIRATARRNAIACVPSSAPKLLDLALLAQHYDIGFNIDCRRSRALSLLTRSYRTARR
jgi:hypothetical protein